MEMMDIYIKDINSNTDVDINDDDDDNRDYKNAKESN